jgi:hypothetical protein
MTDDAPNLPLLRRVPPNVVHQRPRQRVAAVVGAARFSRISAPSALSTGRPWVLGVRLRRILRRPRCIRAVVVDADA